MKLMVELVSGWTRFTRGKERYWTAMVATVDWRRVTMLMVSHVGIQVQTEHIFACAIWWYRMRSFCSAYATHKATHTSLQTYIPPDDAQIFLELLLAASPPRGLR